MKNLKKIAVSLFLFVAATSFAQAQSKVAHINVQALLSEMPEMKAADAELKKLQETYRGDIEDSMTELRNTLYTLMSLNQKHKKKTKKGL